MLSRQRFWLPGLLLGLLLWTPESQATTILKQSLGQLVDEAPLIFVGSAIDQQVELPEAHTSPVTFVTFRVEEVIKGATEDSKLTLAFEGGEWNDEVFEVVGMPSFETGRRYLLFLRSNGAAGGCPTAGWWQGKLDLVPHPLAGNEILVDHRGQPVEGIAGDSWRKVEVRIDEGGLLQSPVASGIAVEEEDGLTITGLPDADANTEAEESLAAVAGARQVLSSLRGLVHQRRQLPTFRSGETLASVDPETLGFRSPLPLKPDRPPADVPDRPEEVMR